jgi:hypothetical protein|tara:strand:- start:250 stop:930 length:681 start_codon:yes stop_codon:yes gene_type:complete
MATVVPDMPDLFEEAYERAGLVLRTGNDLRNIRRSFNLLTMEWQNRGLNLWTIESGTQALTSGTATYTMPADTVDLIEHQIRTGTGTSQVDTNLTRISVSTYSQQSAKNSTGKPTQIFIQRLSASTTITLWPVPNNNTYTLSYYRIAGIDGISSGIDGATTSFVPPRFVPCLVSGLAYYIAMKRPEVANRVAPLKQEYEYQFELAASEDTESASARFVPYDTFYGA